MFSSDESLHKILVVDDDISQITFLHDALKDIGQVLFAQEGLSALEIARNTQPDVILLDIEMPGLDGYELAFEVQNDSALSHAYCILHTSLSSEICIERAHQVGAHEALEKFNASELMEAMLRGAKVLNEA